MRRDDIIARLKTTEPDIRHFGVAALFLFGSRARDDARPNSDIDIFVDPANEAFYDLGNFIGPYRLLVEAFPGLAIGYTTRNGLATGVREQAEFEAVRIF